MMLHSDLSERLNLNHKFENYDAWFAENNDPKS